MTSEAAPGGLGSNAGLGSYVPVHERGHPDTATTEMHRLLDLVAYQSAELRYFRRLLAVRVAMPHTYYDDGEAQGQEHGISIDFMREPAADVDAKLRALNVARFEVRRARMPLGCETPDGCAVHGCRGDCLPPNAKLNGGPPGPSV